MPSFPCHNYTIIEGGFLQNYNSSEYRCFNVIQFPLIFLGDKIIEPPLFVRIKAFVVIFFVNEKRLCEKVSVAYQQALIGTTKCMITDIVLMLRLRDDGSCSFRYRQAFGRKTKFKRNFYFNLQFFSYFLLREENTFFSRTNLHVKRKKLKLVNFASKGEGKNWKIHQNLVITNDCVLGGDNLAELKDVSHL